MLIEEGARNEETSVLAFRFLASRESGTGTLSRHGRGEQRHSYYVRAFEPRNDVQCRRVPYASPGGQPVLFHNVHVR